MRICITGGSGFIGTTAVQAAVDSGYSVLNIDIRPPQLVHHAPYWSNTDILDLPSLKKELKRFQPTHLLHLAATTGMDAPDLNFFRANTDGVRHIIDASVGTGSVERLLFASSLLVCRNGYIPKSDIDYCPVNYYGESKVLGEQIVRTELSPDQWVIVRPTSVWGPRFEHSYKSFFRLVSRGLYVHPGSQRIVKPLTYVRNAVHSMLSLLDSQKENVEGNIFYLADYPEVSTQEWANSIRRNLGLSPLHTAPLGALRLAGKMGDLLKQMGWSDPPLTTFRLNNMLTGAKYPYERTEAIVGKLPVDLDAAIIETLAWMQTHDLISRDLKIGA